MGSRRAPNFDLVLRTPLATARTLPWRSVRNVTIRSASPSRTAEAEAKLTAKARIAALAGALRAQPDQLERKLEGLLAEWGERLFMRGGLPVALGIDRVLAPGREAWRALALTHALGLTAACVAAIVVALRRGAIAAAVLPAYLVLHELIVGSGCAAQWPVHWHFVPESVAMAVGGGLALGVAVPAALRWVRPSTRRITLMAATPMVLALAAMHVVGVLGPVAWSHWLMPSNTDAAARWIEANLPADAKLASFDSGYFGWVLDRPVVNLDGVANTLEYLEDFHLQKRHAAYLEREGITHVVNLITPEEEGQDHFRWVPRSVLVETHAFRAAPGAPVLLFEVAPQR